MIFTYSAQQHFSVPRHPQNPTKHGWPNPLHPLHDHHCHRFPSDFSEWPWRFYLSVASSVESLVKKCPKFTLWTWKRWNFLGGRKIKKNEILPKTRLIDPSLAVESGIIIWHQPKTMHELEREIREIPEKKPYICIVWFPKVAGWSLPVCRIAWDSQANKIRYGLLLATRIFGSLK